MKPRDPDALISFQASNFYQRLGWRKFGQIDCA
jgi:hypothetical protein